MDGMPLPLRNLSGSKDLERLTGYVSAITRSFKTILFQVIFWKEFGFPAPFDRIMDFMHGKVGAGEAIIRVVTLLLTGKLKFLNVFKGD